MTVAESAALGVGILAVVAPEWWDKMPKPLRYCLTVAGFAFLIWTGVLVLREEGMRNGPLALTIAGIALVACGLLWHISTAPTKDLARNPASVGGGGDALAKPIGPAPSSNPAAMPRFEADTGGKISAKGGAFLGTIPFMIGKAETGGEINMDGALWIATDAPLIFPAPPIQTLTKEQIVSEARKLISELRDFQDGYDRERQNILSPDHPFPDPAAEAALREMGDNRAKLLRLSSMPARAINLASALLGMIPGGLPTESLAQNAQTGGHVVLHNAYAGGARAGAAADFLEALIEHVK